MSGQVRVKVDCRTINNWTAFHGEFARLFGFPGFYGRNMDAWIDCMTYLDDPDSGLSSVTCERGQLVVLELEGVSEFRRRCPELYGAIVECSAFVNYRRIEAGEPAVLALSFHQ